MKKVHSFSFKAWLVGVGPGCAFAAMPLIAMFMKAEMEAWQRVRTSQEFLDTKIYKVLMLSFGKVAQKVPIGPTS